ncbi:hypothetical protein FQR65_LT08070 [Abscondita terminalis]|nr:hypothetical protein FQR65_LT08070 [Abscondita terminalis]
MASATNRATSKLKTLLTTLNKTAPRTYFTYTSELSQIIKGKEPVWIPAEEAPKVFECMKSGNTVFSQGAAATPQFLLEAMTEYGKTNNLKGIQVIHMHTEGKAPYTAPELKDVFRSVSTFMGGNVRQAVADGRGDCIPIFLSDIPKLFNRKIYQPDIAVVQVSPPDQHGFVSIGTSVDCVRAALMHSKVIVAQVNKRMPRTFGDSAMHVSHIDYAVCVDIELPQHGGQPPTENEKKIGKLIAENLVVDGATLQLGIGSIPDAVLASLRGHKDLGIHSEMFSGGVVDLVYEGCVTNNKKNHHRGRTVGSFLIGTQKLYDFVDNNPTIEMLVVDHVNDTKIIAQQPNMTAINSCIEVDLTGQICSDSIGTRMYSGFGGQVDFIRGAGAALDGKGKPIIALISATKKGVTKIVPTLKVGAGVVTTRAHANYVVTENGIAELFGKTIAQRARALIDIADPSHREPLEKAAFERFKIMPSKN